MARIARLRTIPVVAMVLVLAWLAVLPGPTSDAAEGTYIRVLAKYTDPDGVRQPLVGVEVWIQEDYGLQRYACTNANGVALFDNVTAGVLHTAGMGPSYNAPRCDNAAFTRPEDGRLMFAVVYDNHHGVLPLAEIVTPFWPVADGVTKIPMVARAARRQKAVCSGLTTTWIGTAADDVYTGTNGNDVINGRGGNDELNGAGGVDYICGGLGHDTITGGKQGDVLLGEGGKDTLSGNLGYDILDGGDGTKDWCRGELLFECER